jgi:Ca-activated chloride channel family protein
MTDFHFLRPWWLIALLPLAALLVLLYRRQSSGGDWREFCDEALLPHVLIGRPARAARLPLGLAGLGGILAILSLAGPAWERLPAPVFRDLSPLVMVLDLSMAMDAADLKPNRLERARFKIEDILHARKDGQTALVVYAGDAFTVTPLTDDAATITAQLSSLAPRLMPVQGSRIDLGLEMAGRLLQQAGLNSGDVLLVTAGDGLADGNNAAAKLRSESYRVSVLGVGTPDGGPVPLAEGGFLKNAEGHIVVPQLNAPALRSLAEAGGGLYRTLDSGSGDLDALLRFFDHRIDKARQTGNTVRIEQWREAGVWLLPLLLPMAALAFRRGWLGIVIVFALGPLPEPADAFEWADMWLTPDQQGQEHFRAGHADEAAQRFRNPEWKAAAEYKAGNYQQAAKDLEKIDTATGQYNRGNALAREGQLEQALKAYDRALQLDPRNEDARHNRKLVEEALRKQQEEQKKQEQQNQQQGQDQGRQPQPSQGEKDGEKQPPEQEKKGDQKQQERENNEGKDQASGEQSPDAEQNGKQTDRQSGAESDGANPAEQRPAPDQGQASEQAEKNGQAKKDEAAKQPVPGEAADKGDKNEPAATTESEASSETRQAEEQWLRRIPDDPGGLLRRKFDYQYRQRQQRQQSERNPW